MPVQALRQMEFPRWNPVTAMPTAARSNRNATPTRSRTNDPLRMKARILDATERLFQARGYHATSMHDVMKAAGVSGGALHHHFPTKKDLALAVIHDRVAPAVAETWIAPVREANSLAVGVKQVLKEIADGIDRRGSVSGCPLNNMAMELAAVDPEFRAAVQVIFKEWQVALANRIERTRAGARMKPQEVRTAARFMIFAYSGAMNLAKTEQSAESLREASQALSQWMRVNDLVG